jgi:RNA polymerase sigma-70 factor (ECF subfamily)
VYHLARSLLGDDAGAAEIVRDVVQQVVGKLDSFRGEAELTTWLHRSTVNAALLDRRKAAPRPEGSLRELPDYPAVEGTRPGTDRQEPPQPHALDCDTGEWIERAIAGLPPVYRDVYVLADVEGLAKAEVGALLGLGLPAVKSRLHRARLLMHAALTPSSPTPRHRYGAKSG